MDFAQILARHARRYPHMQPQDFGKLAFQSEFGPAHMGLEEERVLARLLKELETLPRESTPAAPEAVGGGYCRFPLSMLTSREDARLLAGAFVRSARERAGTMAGLEERLALLEGLQVEGMKEWLEEYRGAGCPVVGHSPQYRDHYHPHYRLITGVYAAAFPVLQLAGALLDQGRPAVLAIDGRCGSGKSTLGHAVQQLLPCNLIHMDDYYMPPEGREEQWMEIPAGNMDLERFEREVLIPAAAGAGPVSRRYRCATGDFAPEEHLPPAMLTVVEGSYSHHPRLRKYYAGTVFVTCPPQVQLDRLQRREGEGVERFLRIWRPLEERYFQAFAIEEGAGLVVDTAGLL